MNGVSGVWMVADLNSNERQREGATTAAFAVRLMGDDSASVDE